MLSGNTFEGTITASPGTNTFTVEATDVGKPPHPYSVEVPAQDAAFAYDANGNLVEKTEGTDIWTYEWKR